MRLTEVSRETRETGTLADGDVSLYKDADLGIQESARRHGKPLRILIIYGGRERESYIHIWLKKRRLLRREEERCPGSSIADIYFVYRV